MELLLQFKYFFPDWKPEHANEKICVKVGGNYCGGKDADRARGWSVGGKGEGGRETERERFAMFRQAQVSWAAQPLNSCTSS